REDCPRECRPESPALANSALSFGDSSQGIRAHCPEWNSRTPLCCNLRGTRCRTAHIPTWNSVVQTSRIRRANRLHDRGRSRPRRVSAKSWYERCEKESSPSFVLLPRREGQGAPVNRQTGSLP